MLDEKKIQRFWDEGIIAPVQRDTPLLLRSRNYSSDPPKLKQMVERFGRGHAGQALTQLPSRPYSYLVDGSSLKKRNLPTNGTSGSESIASRVKMLRRPINKKQKQSRPPGTALASPGSKQYK